MSLRLYLVQVSKIGESGTDYRKFYINNGAKIMRLRAESKYAYPHAERIHNSHSPLELFRS